RGLAGGRLPDEWAGRRSHVARRQKQKRQIRVKGRKAMLNRVILIGRLTRDPELRYTSTGIAVTRFTIACDRKFTNQNGDREADFIPVVAWRGTAEAVANYTRKGSLVGLEGRLQVRS